MSSKKPFLRQDLLALRPQPAYSGRNLDLISFPLGGIGTGSIGLSGRGGLVDCEIFNRPNIGSSFARTFPSSGRANTASSRSAACSWPLRIRRISITGWASRVPPAKAFLIWIPARSAANIPLLGLTLRAGACLSRWFWRRTIPLYRLIRKTPDFPPPFSATRLRIARNGLWI